MCPKRLGLISQVFALQLCRKLTSSAIKCDECNWFLLRTAVDTPLLSVLFLQVEQETSQELGLIVHTPAHLIGGPWAKKVRKGNKDTVGEATICKLSLVLGRKRSSTAAS